MSNESFSDFYLKIYKKNKIKDGVIENFNYNTELFGYEHQLDKIFDKLVGSVSEIYKYLSIKMSILYFSNSNAHNLLYAFYLLDCVYISNWKMFVKTIEDWYHLLQKPIELQFLILFGKIFYILNNFNEFYGLDFNMKLPIPEYNSLLNHIESRYIND